MKRGKPVDVRDKRELVIALVLVEVVNQIGRFRKFDEKRDTF